MNQLDYVIIAIIVFGGIYGLSRGALRMATSILSVMLGLTAASAWYGRTGAIVAQYLHTSPTASAIIGYIGVFLVVAAAIEFAGRRIVRLAHVINLNWIDRVGGALFAAALAAAFAGIDVGLLTVVLPADSTLVRDSALAPKVLAYNESLMALVPTQVKDLYVQKREELIRYWRGQNENPAPDHNGTRSGT